MLRAGGSAADAAVATSAVLAVTSQHLCGMGGDLLAVVHPGGDARPVALNASGRAGSGADPDRLRDRGLTAMPPTGDPASVPVPGCVDGWLTLHSRFGRLPLAEVLEPARLYALEGFPASPGLAAAVGRVAHLPGAGDYLTQGGLSPNALVRRPGVARALADVAAGGRDGFYRGEFGDGLIALGAGEYTPDDLAEPLADWVDAAGLAAWGHRLWTVPPNSQGYLTLSSAWIADRLELPVDPADPRWAHLLIEAARHAGYDRPEALHEGADVTSMLDSAGLARRLGSIDPGHASALGVPTAAGDTIALVAVDSERQGVSLVQSNASGWGSGLIEPSTRIFLHNRGRGFSLDRGHPGEYGPRRRPAHTLCPTLVTEPDGRLKAVLGTMGGDAQPQILLQLLARMLHARQDPASAVAAGRWSLAAPLGPDGLPSGDGFETWVGRGRVSVRVEGNAPSAWTGGLRAMGHEATTDEAWSGSFGHAHAVAVEGEVLVAGSDPRPLAGAAEGW